MSLKALKNSFSAVYIHGRDVTMKTHSISLCSRTIALAVLLVFGQAGAQVCAESPGPELDSTETPQISLSSPASLEQPTAGWEWVDGIPWYTQITDGYGNTKAHGFEAWVGYWQNAEIGQPAVNSVYYVHVVVYGISFPPWPQTLSAGIFFQLPPSTSLAISPSTPIYCFGGEGIATRFDCNQSLPEVTPGQYEIPSGIAEDGNAWPIAAGAGWEFQIPFITSMPLSNSNFIATIHNIDSYHNPVWLYPSVALYVWGPGAFNKTSPTNSATGLSTSPALSWGTSSGATSYSYCYDTTNDNACSNWEDNGTATSKTLSGLAADTTYYWHVRAVNGVGTTYSNASSTAFWSFKTAAAGEFKRVYLPLIAR
jgi:hypothetical protein